MKTRFKSIVFAFLFIAQSGFAATGELNTVDGINLRCGADAPQIENALNVTGNVERVLDGAHAAQGAASIEFRKSGYGNFGGVVSWRLPDDFNGGVYRLHTKYATGGRATLVFTVTQKTVDGFVLGRTANGIRNKASWQADLLAGKNPVTLTPGASVIEVEVKGASSQTKVLHSLFLEKVSAAPRMSADEARLRQQIARSNASDGTEKLYFIDGDDVAAGNAFFPRELNAAQKSKVKTEYVFGSTAKMFVEELNLRSLPAIVRTMNDRVVKGVLYADGSEKPAYAPAGMVAMEELTGGRLGQWLMAGTWLGPAGLSLLGVEQESRILPNEGDSVWVASFDTLKEKEWYPLACSKGGGYVIAEQANASATWSKGCNYAFAYLMSDSDKVVRLEVRQHGFATKAWLNGEMSEPVSHARTGGKKTRMGRTDQGNTFLVDTDGASSVTVFDLNLKKGCNRILLKLLTQHDVGDGLWFDAVFSDASGLASCLTNPESDAKLHRIIRSLDSDIHVTAPSNLPYDDAAIDVVTKFVHPFANGSVRLNRGAKDKYELPVIPIDVVAEQTLTDYDGKELVTKTFDMVIPSVVTNRFADRLERGYYAIQTTLRSKVTGQILATMRPDGFSVIGGVAARRLRQKEQTLKVSSSFYWLTTNNIPQIFPWMARMGVFHNVGSAGRPVFEGAKELGLTLSADFLDPWCATKSADKRTFAEMANEFTRDFKAWNEIDICPHRPSAEKWVARTKLEYEIVKSVDSNAVYTGGTLVRVGNSDWFAACLKLGLDRYVDVWDVHAYPTHVNTFTQRHIGNSGNESGPGVELQCKLAGRPNTKDFIMGEIGARCSHGNDARRWQADTMARMVGWANAAKHYRRIAFLIPWEKATTGGDIAVASFPGEAALYTAAVLIDGLPYAPYTPPNGFAAPCEAAQFGTTLMFWTNGRAFEQGLPFALDANPVLVDVVGRMTPLKQDANGMVKVTISASPLYVLPKADYERLTAR